MCYSPYFPAEEDTWNGMPLPKRRHLIPSDALLSIQYLFSGAGRCNIRPTGRVCALVGQLRGRQNLLGHLKWAIGLHFCPRRVSKLVLGVILLCQEPNAELDALSWDAFSD